MSNAVEKFEAPAVPALAPTPALDLGSEDISLPRIKIGQFMTNQVKEQLAKAGQIFVSDGPDDANVIYDPEKDKDGVLFHVIGLKKGKSITVDGQLETFAFNDPSAPADAWTTYDYLVCLPEVDDEVPHKFLFTRMAAGAAKQINTLLKKNEARGPVYALAFRVTTVKRENNKGTFFVPRVTQVEASQAGVEAAAALASQMTSASIEQSAPVGSADEPAI